MAVGSTAWPWAGCWGRAGAPARAPARPAAGEPRGARGRRCFGGCGLSASTSGPALPDTDVLVLGQTGIKILIHGTSCEEDAAAGTDLGAGRKASPREAERTASAQARTWAGVPLGLGGPTEGREPQAAPGGSDAGRDVDLRDVDLRS